MCVLSNNSHKESIISDINKNIPNHISELLNSLEKWTRSFNIISEVQRNCIKLIFKEKESRNHDRNLRCIQLSIFNDPKSYLIILFQIHKENANNTNKEKLEELYQIKVEGDYELNSIENDMRKLFEGKNLTHYRKYYPF